MGILKDLSPTQLWLLNYSVTFFGAVVIYIFSLNPKSTSTLRFLKQFFPNKTEQFYIWLDFVIVIFTGTILVTIILSPQDPKAALSAGLGFMGALNSLVNTKK